ncbi:MAG: hypothetical protein ACTSX8_10600 [Alphaproteobacteria bacterium]
MAEQERKNRGPQRGDVLAHVATRGIGDYRSEALGHDVSSTDTIHERATKMSDPRDRWKERGVDSAFHFAPYVGFEREFCEADDGLNDLWASLDPVVQAALYNYCWDLVARSVGEKVELPVAKVINFRRKT